MNTFVRPLAVVPQLLSNRAPIKKYSSVNALLSLSSAKNRGNKTNTYRLKEVELKRHILQSAHFLRDGYSISQPKDSSVHEVTSDKTDNSTNSDDSNCSTESEMQRRLKLYKLQEKPIAADGNCQFRAIADQMWGKEEEHAVVRNRITEWLKRNEKFALNPSDQLYLSDFLDREAYPTWGEYCDYISRNTAWGDQLTLVAATETFNVHVWVISNVFVAPAVNSHSHEINDGHPPYVTILSPRNKSTRTIRLGHHHEFHYTSLEPLNETSSSKRKSA